MPKKKKEDIPALDDDRDLSKIVTELKQFINADDDSGDITYFLDTGNLALNYVISQDLHGGYPSGRTIELFGEPSTGKTLLLTRAGAKMQQRGGVFVMMDSEQRWDWKFAATNGVNTDMVIYYQPQTIEEFTTRTYDLLRRWYKGVPFLIALDSLADLDLEAEISKLEKGEMGEDQGRRAKRMKAAVRELRHLIFETQSILLLASHVYSDPNSMSRRAVSGGGRGPQYRSSVRIEMEKPRLIFASEDDEKRGKRPIGSQLNCTVVKNSIAPPFGRCTVDVYWSTGVDEYSGLLELMKELDIIELSGGWYSYGDIKFRGSEVARIIQEHPEILQDSKWKDPYFMHRR